MPGLGGLFGRGSIGEQLFVWGLLSQVVNALTAPGISELAQLMNSATTVEPLSPAEVASAVVRGFMSEHDAENEAAKSGLDAARLKHLVQLSGQAPPPGVLMEALRRGLLQWDAPTGSLPSALDGIREGNLRDVWAPLMRELDVQLPSWSDALDALLEGQLDEKTAREWFTRAGGDPQAFQWLFDTRGSSPTPDMLGTMANRGIIAWTGLGPGATTFEQGFREGPWRNKWEPAMRRLMEYLPPPRTVTAMLRAGSLTEPQALALLEKEGLTPELAAAYVADATKTKTAAAKQFSQSQIETLLRDHVISPADAATMLEQLGYDAKHAALIVSQAGVARTIANTNNAITRIRSLYIGHKLDKAAATRTLHTLGVDSAQAADMIGVWELEQAANVKLLTPAQIAAAFHLQIMTQDEAIAELVADGYHAYDAWVLLSIHEKKKLPNPPPRD